MRYSWRRSRCFGWLGSAAEQGIVLTPALGAAAVSSALDQRQAGGIPILAALAEGGRRVPRQAPRAGGRRPAGTPALASAVLSLQGVQAGIWTLDTAIINVNLRL